MFGVFLLRLGIHFCRLIFIGPAVLRAAHVSQITRVVFLFKLFLVLTIGAVFIAKGQVANLCISTLIIYFDSILIEYVRHWAVGPDTLGIVFAVAGHPAIVSHASLLVGDNIDLPHYHLGTT